HGTLQTGEIARRGGVLVIPPDEDEFQWAVASHTATGLVQGWVSDLRSLLERSFQLLAERARKVAAAPDSEFPVGTHGEFLMILALMPKYKALVEFLQLWTEEESANPKKLQYMYSRLTDAWRTEWSFQQFKEFIGRRAVTGWSFVGPGYSGTDEAYGE